MNFFSATFVKLDILLFKFNLWSQRKANLLTGWAARLTMQSVIKRKQLIKALNNDSVLCYDTDDNMILVCQALLITTAEHGFFCGSLKSFCFLLDGRLFFINILNTSNGVPECLLIGAERNREPPRCMVSVIGTWIVYIRKTSLSFSFPPVIIFSAIGENCSKKYIWNKISLNYLNVTTIQSS